MSHLKKTIITPFEPRYSNRPDGAVCYKLKKALDVSIVKGTTATLCHRFASPWCCCKYRKYLLIFQEISHIFATPEKWAILTQKASQLPRGAVAAIVMRCFTLKAVLFYFALSSETLRNCFISFSTSKDALRARVPAALFPFSAWSFASVANAA